MQALVYGEGGPLGLLLAFLFSCRDDWQRGKGRRALEILVHLPHVRGLLKAAGLEELPTEAWRCFLSAEELSVALPGFMRREDAARALGKRPSDHLSLSTVKVGRRALVVEQAVQRVARG